MKIFYAAPREWRVGGKGEKSGRENEEKSGCGGGGEDEEKYIYKYTQTRKK